MSFLRPFCRTTALAGAAVTALAFFTWISILPSHAQTAQTSHPGAVSDIPKSDNPKPSESAKPSDSTKASDSAKAETPQTTGTRNVASVDQKSLTAKTIDKVKQVAKSAGDIFSRVPCSPPKGGARAMGSLPHVATKLASGQPVEIIAFGSSSTAGYGTSSPEFTYPNRLAAQLRRQYPGVEINVVNRGKGGEDAAEMMKRLQTEVIDMKPDMVIWQVGTNAVLRNIDPDETAKQVEVGIMRIQAAGADLVLVDPQYSPRVNERAESANKMIKLLGRVAELRHVGIFPRFQIMRDWHEKQAIPIDNFVIADGLHMNDWGYACFAQLLGDDIIKSVGQIKLGVNLPAKVQAYRPM